MTDFLIALYLLSVLGLSLYGAMGYITFLVYLRHRNDRFPSDRVTDADLPSVTVQLPVYNEKAVVTRLISAAVALDYPPDRLQIQVLDDSTDETTLIVAERVRELRAQGVDIVHLHREDRTGFKAGALQAALASATGEYIAVFDADFEPLPSFLRQTIPFFLQSDHLGVVQTRWGHSNDTDSFLTAAQAIALDKHFAMEQVVRHRARLYPKFNGSGGIWRRRCLDDAGGWEADTVCEDLCLSTRAVLRGWDFLFLPDVVAPAELPNTILAYKNQQARWAEGSSQCLRKYGREIWADRTNTRGARLYSLFSMSAYSTHFLMLIILLVQVPLLLLDFHYPPWLIAATVAGLGQPILFITAQYVLHRDWARRLRTLPFLLFIAVGMAPSNARAILKGLFGRQHTFVRTPKGHSTDYGLRVDSILLVELALAVYAAVGLWLALARGSYGPILLMATCMLGFLYVACLGVMESQKSGVQR